MKKALSLLLVIALFCACEKEEIPVACCDYELSDSNKYEVAFVNCSEDASSYFWDFGDGNTSSEESPFYSFTSEFPYLITLISTNEFGSDTLLIEIGENDLPFNPKAQFEYVLTGECLHSVKFTNTSLNATSYSWDFGDGKVSTEKNPEHYYNVWGKYDVTLKANINDEIDEYSKTIEVVDTVNIYASFYFVVNENNSKEIHFFNTSRNGVDYNWSFGDESSSTDKNPVYTFSDYGVYEVTLNVKNGDKSKSVTQVVDIIESQYVVDACCSFEVDSENSMKYHFINCSENASHYLWTFDTGFGVITSEEENPVITFEGNETDLFVMVSLKAWNDNLGHDETNICVPYECILVGKPNVYIYPEEKTSLEVELFFPQGGHIDASVPDYGEGWEVFVEPDGRIDRMYDYLFYESTQRDVYQRSKGWCVSQLDLNAFFEQNMRRYQFNNEEIKDFTKYWVPRLIDSDYYNIYPQTNNIINEVIQLKFSQMPDNVIRLFYVIEPVEEQQLIRTPSIPNFKREGFVVTEWGVIY